MAKTGPKPHGAVIKICLGCGSKFEVPYIRRNKTKNCSFFCGVKSRPKPKSGREHGNFKSGISTYWYRKIAFNHYGKVCDSCGKTGDPLIVHHRNHNRHDNTPGNLQPLCQGCHLTEHRSNKEFRDKMRDVAKKYDYASHFHKNEKASIL